MSDHNADAMPVRPETEHTLALTRLVAGAAQGLALYLLYRWAADKVWPATDPYWLAPLGLVFLFVPLLLVQGAGTLRTRTLVPWFVGVTALLAGLGWYSVWRGWPPAGAGGDIVDGGMTFALVAASFVGLFIAQSLVLAADAERRFIAPYPAYFDAATKLGVQFAATVAFVAVFWGVLWLGAVLFNLIKLDFLETLLEKDWFAIPATTLAAAAAIHVTDVRAKLWTGIRTVALDPALLAFAADDADRGRLHREPPVHRLTPLWGHAVRRRTAAQRRRRGRRAAEHGVPGRFARA
ncbi:MAG: hypothetical protein WDM81_15670 [Rhizomicrobium sp.]